MAHDSPAQHSPPEAPKRPRGILKNSNSFQNAAPDMNVSPTSERPPLLNESAVADGTPSSRPSMPPREMSEKELTQMNTEINAGGAHRRNSSNPNANANSSRRQSSASNAADATHDEQGMRLKWDEANLYLNEGQMGGRMKIDEPKTPYAGRYDPMEDEEEISTINAQGLAVDELDMEKGGKSTQNSQKRTKDGDIPGLDLGEPEMGPDNRRESEGDRQVIIESDGMEVDGVGNHGEEREEDMSAAEKAKHRKFEEMRKKHYEMHNVKNLLGHGAEDLVDEDDGGR